MFVKELKLKANDERIRIVFEVVQQIYFISIRMFIIVYYEHFNFN